MKRPSRSGGKIALWILGGLLLLFALAFAAVRPRGTEDYLIYGIDQYGSLDADGRSDAMMLVRLDHRQKKIYAVTLARDLFVAREDGRVNKINTIVRGNVDVGGEALLRVIDQNFGVRPDGWVRVNFSSLVSIVDALGGVRVELTAEEARYIDRNAGWYPGYPLSQGECLLCGAQALSFVRCRHLDDDLGRGQRQSRFAAALKEALSGMRIPQLRDLYQSMNHAWRTYLSAGQQSSLLFRALFARRYSVVRLQIPFEGTWRFGNQGSVPGILADLPENRRLLLSAFGESPLE